MSSADPAQRVLLGGELDFVDLDQAGPTRPSCS